MITDEQRVVDYFYEHGFYFASNPNQEKAADKVVESGLLRKVDPSWFVKPGTNCFYVHSSVDCKAKMPASLAGLVYGDPPIRKNELVYVSLLTTQGNDVESIGKVTEVGETRVEVSIDGSSVWVPLKDVRRG